MKAIKKAPAGRNMRDIGKEEGSISHKKQPLDYVQGKTQAGSGISEAVEGVVDLPRKKPYGKKKLGWAETSGKLGDLDPQETDQPSWVGTWSNLQKGPNGTGTVQDENYTVQRPRTQSRLEERFRECNPEFQDVADDGDWTSAKWTPNV